MTDPKITRRLAIPRPRGLGDAVAVEHLEEDAVKVERMVAVALVFERPDLEGGWGT